MKLGGILLRGSLQKIKNQITRQQSLLTVLASGQNMLKESDSKFNHGDHHRDSGNDSVSHAMQTKIIRKKTDLSNLGKQLKTVLPKAADPHGELQGIQFIRPRDIQNFIAKPTETQEYVVIVHFDNVLKSKLNEGSHITD